MRMASGVAAFDERGHGAATGTPGSEPPRSPTSYTVVGAVLAQGTGQRGHVSAPQATASTVPPASGPRSAARA
jgi:hypothetical protein